MDITTATATEIANVLNMIGVVTHDDFGFVTRNEFGKTLEQEEDFLRECGYIGGPIKEWNTGFRTDYWVYGAVDADRNFSDEILDKYFTAISFPIAQENVLEVSELLVDELRQFKLKLVFRCVCGVETTISPELYSLNEKRGLAFSAKCICSKCKSKITGPVGVTSIFAPYKFEL